MKNIFPIIIVRKSHVDEMNQSIALAAKKMESAQRVNTLLGVITLILVVAVAYAIINDKY